MLSQQRSKAGQHHIHELELSTDPRPTDLGAQPERAKLSVTHMAGKTAEPRLDGPEKVLH